MGLQEKVSELKRRLDALRQTRARSEGQLETYMNRLRTDHACKTLDEARKRYAKTKDEIETAENGLDDALAELEIDIRNMEDAADGR